MNEDAHVVTEVWLASHQNNGRSPVGCADLWDPFGGNVGKGAWVDQAEAEDENIHMGKAQRAKVAKTILIKQEATHSLKPKKIQMKQKRFALPVQQNRLVSNGQGLHSHELDL